MAAFDMDWTILKPKSGALFPKNAHDWCWLYKDTTRDKLKELHVKDGFRIVIFSNQGGVAHGKTSTKELETKFTAIQSEVDVPMCFIAAIDYG